MVTDGLEGMRSEPMPDILSEEANESIVGRATRRFEALNRVRRERLRNLKPWKEFFEAGKFSTPTRGEIFSRLMHNMSYFNSNYVVVVALVTLYTLVTNLAFSLAMGSIVGFWLWYRTRNTPLYIGNTELSPFQVNAGLIVSGLIVFYATSGSSTIFWLVVLAGFCVVGHAVMRVPDIASSPMGDLMASMVPNIV